MMLNLSAPVVIFIVTIGMFFSDPLIHRSLQHHQLSGSDGVSDGPKGRSDRLPESFSICRNPGNVRRHLSMQRTPQYQAHTRAQGITN